MKKIICIALLFVIAFTGCNDKVSTIPPIKVEKKVEVEEYLNIMTTNKLLYFMVKDIVKDRHNVDYMLKTESDQWFYLYSEDAINNISNKDLFIYLGAEFEPWAENFINNIDKNKVTVVNSSRGIKILTLATGRSYGDIQLNSNPYYWMDPNLYKVALYNIKNSIQEKDPESRTEYESNYNECIQKIDEVKSIIKNNEDYIKNSIFITIGDELDYFTDGLNIKPIKIYSLDDLPNLQDKLEKKDPQVKNIVILSNNMNQFVQYSEFINKYSIKSVEISTYKEDMDYISLLKYDYSKLFE